MKTAESPPELSRPIFLRCAPVVGIGSGVRLGLIGGASSFFLGFHDGLVQRGASTLLALPLGHPALSGR